MLSPGAVQDDPQQLSGCRTPPTTDARPYDGAAGIRKRVANHLKAYPAAPTEDAPGSPVASGAAASLRISMRHPVNRAANRAF